MKRARLGLLYAALIILIGANITALLQRERIGDWWVLRGYAAPTTITSLADQTTMTAAGRHLFYVNHPTLEDKAGFNAQCANNTEYSIVLGCYHGNRAGIYLYNVQDSRLEGVKQVTAAHEMLHQAYDRLSEKERMHIDNLLQDFAATSDLEQRIKDKLELYKKGEANSVSTEMHSIFGTEVAVLPAGLEAYYSRYFNDRHKVVAFSEAYQGEFAARKTKVEIYDQQLDALNSRIEANKHELENRQKTLAEERRQVQSLLSRGDTTAYQAGATAYNKQVAEYNALIDSTQQLIAEYNNIVAERNALTTEEQELQKALDSRLTESPAQ